MTNEEAQSVRGAKNRTIAPPLNITQKSDMTSCTSFKNLKFLTGNVPTFRVSGLGNQRKS